MLVGNQLKGTPASLVEEVAQAIYAMQQLAEQPSAASSSPPLARSSAPPQRFSSPLATGSGLARAVSMGTVLSARESSAAAGTTAAGMAAAFKLAEEMLVFTEHQFASVHRSKLTQEAIKEVEEPLRRDLSRAASIAGPLTAAAGSRSRKSTAVGGVRPRTTGGPGGLLLDESSDVPPLQEQLLGEKSFLMGTRAHMAFKGKQSCACRPGHSLVLRPLTTFFALPPTLPSTHPRPGDAGGLVRSSSQRQLMLGNVLVKEIERRKSQAISQGNGMANELDVAHGAEPEDQLLRLAHRNPAELVDPVRHERVVAAFENTLIQLAAEGVLWGPEADTRVARASVAFAHVRASMGFDPADLPP